MIIYLILSCRPTQEFFAYIQKRPKLLLDKAGGIYVDMKMTYR